MITLWSIPSFILGFHAVYGVLAGMKISSQGKQVMSIIQSMSTPQQQPRHPNTPIPNLPHFLERGLDIRKLAPKKRHLKPQRLLRRMGKDFDTFWMSQRLPKYFSKVLTKRNVDSSLRSETSSLGLQTLAKDLFTSLEESFIQTANGSNTDSNSTASALDPTLAKSKVIDGVKSWLVRMGSCPVYYKWEDLGLLYWPRWVRTGSCSRPVLENSIQKFIRAKLSNDSSAFSKPSASPTPSCSWPSGMHCVPGKEKKLKLLRWTCKHSRPEEFDQFRRTGKNNNNIGTRNTTAHDIRKGHVDHQNHFDVDQHHYDDHFDHHEDEYHHHTDEDSHTDHESLAEEQTKEPFTKGTKIGGTNGKKSLHPKSHESRRHQERGEKHDREIANFLESKMLNTAQPKSARQLRHTTKSFGSRFSGRRVRRESVKGQKTDNHHHHGKSTRRSKKRRSGFRCKWVKITHPVVDDCYCSC